MNEERLVYEMPQAILNWYDFKDNSIVLLVYNNNSSLLELLQSRHLIVTCASEKEIMTEEFVKRFDKTFNYIISIGVIETCKKPEQLLKCFRKIIGVEGRLLLGTDNRFGIKYFCGDKDPYTFRFFDGIEGYRRQDKKQIENRKGRCYSKSEILNFLNVSEWNNTKVYSVFPNLSAPQFIFAENYPVSEELSIRYFPKYNSPETVFVKEEFLYSDLIENNLFYEMSNAFLFECSVIKSYAPILQVTISMDRGHDNSLATIIRDDQKVIKKALFQEGIQKFYDLQENTEILENHGISVIRGEIQGDRYIMPRIDAELGNVYLYKLLEKEPSAFIQAMDHFRDLILRSSEEIDGEYDRDNLGIILKKGFIDMVPLNSFYIEGEFSFFDQEFVVDNYPANAIIYRAIAIVYEDDPRRQVIIPEEFFWKRYGLESQITRLQEKSAEFTHKLRHQDELKSYNQKCYRNEDRMKENRYRMDYSEKIFEELFYNPFANLENKKLFLFGSGCYAKKFIDMYHRDYEIEAILDNDVEKLGQKLEGYEIKSPDILYKMSPDLYKVVICIKNYVDVLWQLQEMGVANIAIYQKDKIYPGRQASVIYEENKAEKEPKKYHIGYIAGVFDLYHLGHLNMFRRAKELCDYLIVGVVTDRGVRDFKNTEPYVPFEERIEMVRACRYVNEVVEIPFIFRTTIEAFEKYHFDVQFSGSDYENDPGWLEHKRYLEANGATLIFFPYTNQTSSTKLKALIDRGII